MSRDLRHAREIRAKRASRQVLQDTSGEAKARLGRLAAAVAFVQDVGTMSGHGDRYTFPKDRCSRDT